MEAAVSEAHYPGRGAYSHLEPAKPTSAPSLISQPSRFPRRISSKITGISVKPYTPELAEHWAAVLANSKNGVFLFERRFLEYHGDRLTDQSAIAYVGDVPAALLPVAIDRIS